MSQAKKTHLEILASRSESFPQPLARLIESEAKSAGATFSLERSEFEPLGLELARGLAERLVAGEKEKDLFLALAECEGELEKILDEAAFPVSTFGSELELLAALGAPKGKRLPVFAAESSRGLTLPYPGQSGDIAPVTLPVTTLCSCTQGRRFWREASLLCTSDSDSLFAIAPLLRKSLQNGLPLLLLAPSFTKESLATLGFAHLLGAGAHPILVDQDLFSPLLERMGTTSHLFKESLVTLRRGRLHFPHFGSDFPTEFATFLEVGSEKEALAFESADEKAQEAKKSGLLYSLEETLFFTAEKWKTSNETTLLYKKALQRPLLAKIESALLSPEVILKELSRKGPSFHFNTELRQVEPAHLAGRLEPLDRFLRVIKAASQLSMRCVTPAEIIA